MLTFLVCLVLVAIQATADKTTPKNPGYDITPLKERVIPDQVKEVFKKKTLISANPICRRDAATLCPATSSDNLLLLPCMQSQAERVSPMCHQVLWKYKVYLTMEVTVGGPLLTHCESQFPRIPECKKANPYNGEMVSCILNNKKNITDRNCRLTIFRMQKMIFSDHRLIYGFNKACGQDIMELKCGRVERNETIVFDTGAGQQGLVVSCLEDNIDHLSAGCLKQIDKKEEVAAESIELDAALAQACQLEVSVMCKSIPPGKGNLYRCLFDHMNEPTMKSKCRRQLMRRGKEESQDFRMDYKFNTACNKAIKRYSCDQEAYTEGSFTKTVNVLQCLNNLATQGSALTDDCKAEMATMVTLLMGNYQLDMTLAAACDVDVADHCTMEKNMRQEGGVIACLMTMEKKKRLTDPCSVQIQQLIAAAVPTFTQAVDHITRQRCQTLYKEMCGGLVSRERFSCLMDHANDQGTDPICRNHLLTLQYFLARDYRMDQPLRDACRDDVNKVCSLNYKQSSMEYPPAHVIHCLYTSYLTPATKDEISLQCVHEVQRVMLIRSSSIDLNPYIEKSCMEDLSFFCGEVDTAIPGEEFKCLQENMENLSEECHKAIGSWTKMESKDIEMDRPLLKVCKQMIKQYCEGLPKGSGEIIHCLASAKNELNFDEQCRSEVTDYQKTILQKYEYDPAFIEACGHDAHTLCDIEKTKAEVMECLLRKANDLPTACRTIIRKERREQNENIELNPEVHSDCETDVQHFCPDIHAGGGKVMECLRKHFHRLSKPCGAVLAPKQVTANKDARVDYVLMKSCKDGIEKYCEEVDPSEVLNCLIQHKFKFALSSDCRAAIVTRETMIFQDQKLNTRLQRACGQDIHVVCPDVPGYAIIRCLYRNDKDEDGNLKVSAACANLLTQLMAEKQTDYRFNLDLIDGCDEEKVFKNCLATNRPGRGSVIECLKKKIDALKSSGGENNACYKAVAELIGEAGTNVKIDVKLDQACASDIEKFCSKITPGSTRVIGCLNTQFTRDKEALTPECLAALQSRHNMWNFTGMKTFLKKAAVLQKHRRQQQDDSPSSDDETSYSPSTGSRSLWIFLIVLGIIVVFGLVFCRKFRKSARKYT